MNIAFNVDLLTPEQIDGLACGVCGFDYTKEDLAPGQLGRAAIPVGHTGDELLMTIMACAESCVPRVAAFDKLFAQLDDTDLRLAIGYIEVANKDILTDALEHVIALKASGETDKIRDLRVRMSAK